MTQFSRYKRTQMAWLRPYEPDEDMTNIMVSDTDALNGSPKVGDMIARNPMNPSDQWLVAEAYFKANFEPCPE